MSRGKEFADLIHNVVIMGTAFEAKDVAASLNLSYDAFYARVSNRVMFAPEEIRALMARVPDPRIPAWLLGGTPFVPARRPEAASSADTPEDSLRHSSIMMLVEASEVAREIEVAIADDRIDHRESRLIQREIEAAERAIATVREHVKSLTR